MPFFRFMLHGRVRLSLLRDDGPREGEGGFYTTRWAYAPTMDEAAKKAIAAVRQDWTTGSSSHLGSGQPPSSITIEKGRRIGVLDIPKAPNKGNTLYFDGDDDDGLATLH